MGLRKDCSPAETPTMWAYGSIGCRTLEDSIRSPERIRCGRMNSQLHWSKRPHRSRRSLCSALLLAGITAAAAGVHAEDAASRPVATKHQMMKECMAKQKASDAGLSKEQMKKNCKDVTQTERENAKADKKTADQTAAPPRT